MVLRRFACPLRRPTAVFAAGISAALPGAGLSVKLASDCGRQPSAAPDDAL
jgi:hypothetical protein